MVASNFTTISPSLWVFCLIKLGYLTMKRQTIARHKIVERRKHALRGVCEAAAWFIALLRSREEVSAGLESCLVLIVAVAVDLSTLLDLLIDDILDS